GALRGASDDRRGGAGDVVRPDTGVQRPAAGEGAREGGVGDHGGRAAEPAALLVAPGRGGVSRADPGDGAGDQRVGRGGAGGVADDAAGGGWCAGAEPGDSAAEDQEVAGA